MDLVTHWDDIVDVIGAGQKSSLHCSIATVDDQGMPNVTPIGTVFLRSDQSAYFFDTYTSTMSDNLKSNQNICLMAVNTGALFWLKSFFKGQFVSAPGVRLYGKAGELREATAEEKASIERRIRSTRWLKGSQLLWSDFTHVRDIQFQQFRPVQYPKMMDHLWQS